MKSEGPYDLPSDRSDLGPPSQKQSTTSVPELWWSPGWPLILHPPKKQTNINFDFIGNLDI